MEYLHHLSFAVSVVGVLVIILGIFIGLVRFLRSEILSLRGNDVATARQELRHALGYYLLLGLEFLIAADIIETLMKPTLQDLAALGAIVIIRTLINYSLTSELSKKSLNEPKLTAL